MEPLNILLRTAILVPPGQSGTSPTCEITYRITDPNEGDTVIPYDQNENEVKREGTVPPGFALEIHHIRSSTGTFLPGGYVFRAWFPGAAADNPSIYVRGGEGVNLDVSACNSAGVKLVSAPTVVAVHGSSVVVRTEDRILYSTAQPAPPQPSPTVAVATKGGGLYQYRMPIVLALIVFLLIIYFYKSRQPKPSWES